MSRSTNTPGETWPILMRASTAAAYLDEASVESFRRRVGSLYPLPQKIRGRGELWLRDDLDKSWINCLLVMTGSKTPQRCFRVR